MSGNKLGWKKLGEDVQRKRKVKNEIYYINDGEIYLKNTYEHVSINE